MNASPARSNTIIQRDTFQSLEVWVYLGWLALAEVLSLRSASLGFIAHTILLITCLVRSMFTEDRHWYLNIVFAVLPLVRILTLVMPVALAPTQSIWIILINVPLIVATAVASRVAGMPPRSLGLRAPTKGGWTLQLAVIAAGLGIGYLESYIISPARIAAPNPLGLALQAGNLMLFTGFAEELLFRGALLAAAVRALGKQQGILFSSLAFGVLHAGTGSLADVVYVTLVGLFFGVVAHRSKSIIGVSIAHGLANIVLFMVFTRG